ncbi:MAG TPA: helix-turn-helix domain-containing protein [Flavitalea sp.]|nr:helix-turn-helix domain-containing protein [Flavitalea sp.]
MKAETIQEFYHRHALVNELKETPASRGQFNVYRREDFCGSQPTTYNRRDFYKISLVIGTGKLYYADRALLIDAPALMFSNPLVPYSWEPLSAEQRGYFCVFTADFLNETEATHAIFDSSLFRIGGSPVSFLNEHQLSTVASIFERMAQENQSDYALKYDLIRNYVNLLFHEAIRLQPTENFIRHNNASGRITSLFIELLERQFPIESQAHPLRLRTASAYSQALSLHVNHLNRSVKEVTGMTTTEHIFGRIIKEAKALLLHTDWDVAEIGYSLGFDTPSYFNNFFRKQTAATPLSFRD